MAPCESFGIDHHWGGSDAPQTHDRSVSRGCRLETCMAIGGIRGSVIG
ncbi:hypothetical protein L665_04395 [Ralstonia solanacearum SD54]|nr:hypothetical protein L665_04395 [Ralstonia solanacearum SD54]